MKYGQSYLRDEDEIENLKRQSELRESLGLSSDDSAPKETGYSSALADAILKAKKASESEDDYSPIAHAITTFAPTILGYALGGARGGAVGADAGLKGGEVLTKGREKSEAKKENAEKLYAQLSLEKEKLGEESNQKKILAQQKQLELIRQLEKDALDRDSKEKEFNLKKQELGEKALERRQKQYDDAVKRGDVLGDAVDEYEAKKKSLNASEKEKVGHYEAALLAMYKAREAENLSRLRKMPIVDTPYETEARIAAESFGRGQSGGAINKDEEKRFSEMLPGLFDSDSASEKKYKALEFFLKNKIKNYGVDPDKSTLINNTRVELGYADNESNANAAEKVKPKNFDGKIDLLKKLDPNNPLLKKISR